MAVVVLIGMRLRLKARGVRGVRLRVRVGWAAVYPMGERDEHATPCDRYAPVIDSECEVQGGVAACLAWEVVTCIEDVERSEPVDVGLRGRVAREGSCAMMLPKRNSAMPSTACNAVGDSSRW